MTALTIACALAAAAKPRQALDDRARQRLPTGHRRTVRSGQTSAGRPMTALTITCAPVAAALIAAAEPQQADR